MKKAITLVLILLFLFALTACSKAEPTTATPDQSDVIAVSKEAFDAKAYYKTLQSCVSQIKAKTDFVPDIALVLGSGLRVTTAP